jgi:hypothetical protein
MSRQYLLLFGFPACITVAAVLYASHEREQAKAAAAAQGELAAKLESARTEIKTLSSQISSLSAAVTNQPALAPRVQSPIPSRRVSPGPATALPTARPNLSEDPRWRRVESQLAAHQSELAEQRKRISETQDDVRRSSDQLDGKINSTRDELNQSIATTHEEVLALQKRGERNIYEFDLVKSKQFQRVGPVSLALRKADVKHGSYKLGLIVDDKTLEKEHVNLFEPVWITISGLPQPVQLVVNRIDKDHVGGYISEPRYKLAELGDARAPDPAHTPALKTR